MIKVSAVVVLLRELRRVVELLVIQIFKIIISKDQIYLTQAEDS